MAEPCTEVVLDERDMLLHTLRVCAFILSVYTAGTIMSYIKGPALVAEILIGLLFARGSTGWFPTEFEQAFMSLGYVGLYLMIFDGGVHMDIGMLRKIGARAFLLAVTGCFIPVILIWLVYAYGFDYPFLPSIAAGTALSSTAIGFTVQVLNDNGILQAPLGQLIMAGAMLDDVISLILLAMLDGLTGEGGSFNAMTVLKPLLASAGIMIGLYLLRVILVCIDKKTKLTERLTPEEHVQLERKRVIIYIGSMLIMAVLCVWLADEIGSSYLLGAFMAGMVATTWPHFQDVWDELCEPVLPWLCRCFFACTVGFAVPVQALGSGGAGLIILTIVIAIISKFVTGVLATGPRDPKFFSYVLQVGTAMVGRGELGFVQIQTARKGVMAQKATAEQADAAFGAIVWALLIASLVGPVLFRFALKMKPRGENPATESFVLAYNSGETQEASADVEDGLPRLLANPVANDAGTMKKEKPAEAPISENVQA